MNSAMSEPILSASKSELHKKNIQSLIKSSFPFYLMLLPGLLWYIIFRYVPMYGVIIAFKDFNISEGILRSSWAHPFFKHFQMFFQSPYFELLIKNTLLISIYKIVFGMIPPLLLAIMLSECKISWFKRVIQTLSYMPHFLSWVIIYGILVALFSESTGLFNRLVVEGGGKTIPFLSSSEWFRTMLVSSDIWQNAGWGAILYLAAITGIDISMYEAAIIDGCSRLKRIWYVTLPNISNVFFMLLILRLGSILDAGFEQIFVMYNVNVYEVGDIIDTWVYRTGLEKMNFSLATAVSLFKSGIGFTLMFSANAISRKWGEKSIW